MRFNFIFLMSLVLVHCSSQSPETKPINIGVKTGDVPTFYAAKLSTTIAYHNQVVIADTKIHRLQRFNMEPLSLVSSTPLPLDYKDQGVVVGKNDNFYIVAGGTDFAIMHRDGSFEKNPISLEGNIQTLAYDEESNILFVRDNLNSNGIVVLSDSGDVVDSWVGGSLLSADGALKVGAVMADGSMIAIIGDSTLAKVDLKGSVGAKKWKYQVAATSVPSVSAIAGIPNQTGLAYLMTGTGGVLLNTSSMTVKDEWKVTASMNRFDSNNGTPHTITATDQDLAKQIVKIHYVDASGGLVEQSLATNSTFPGLLSSSRASLLSLADDQIIFLSSGETFKENPTHHEVFKYRLSDSLLVKHSAMDVRGPLALTPKYILIHHPSPLGSVERRDYGKDPNGKLLEGFNQDALRQAYQEQ